MTEHCKHSYNANILLDSISPDGVRLLTWQLTYPRWIHSELMTYRMWSRNAASSRAIPVEKLIWQVENYPAMPVFWGKNQPGMQAAEELDAKQQSLCESEWLYARDKAVVSVKALHSSGLHKQLANRLLEPWMFITVIVTATDFKQFYKQRRHKDAQPEFKVIADMMWDRQAESTPQLVDWDDWHLPMLGHPGDEELSLHDKRHVSVARCARVSYLTHDGQRDVEADIALYERLKGSGHWSPFEHVATPKDSHGYRIKHYANFKGWSQLRSRMSGENADA